MVTREDLESFFIRLGVAAEEVEENIWVLHGGGAGDGADVVVTYAPPVVVLRLKVMELPQDAQEQQLVGLYRKLLELNISDMVHGSYGIEEGDIALSDALDLETLDFAELRSSYESLVFAASTHMKSLAALIPVGQEG